MKLDQKARAEFRGEDGSSLTVHYENRGEPYRQGISLSLEGDGGEYIGSVFLDEYEVVKLRDMLNRLTGKVPEQIIPAPAEGGKS